MKALRNKQKYHFALVPLLTLCLIGCAGKSNRLTFPEPDPKAAEQIKPCLKEGSELHDWIDRIYKLKDQINT